MPSASLPKLRTSLSGCRPPTTPTSRWARSTEGRFRRSTRYGPPHHASSQNSLSCPPEYRLRFRNRPASSSAKSSKPCGLTCSRTASFSIVLLRCHEWPWVHRLDRHRWWRLRSFRGPILVERHHLALGRLINFILPLLVRCLRRLYLALVHPLHLRNLCPAVPLDLRKRPLGCVDARRLAAAAVADQRTPQ